METYGELDVHLHSFLISALDGGDWSDSHPGCSTRAERAFGVRLG